MKLKKRKIPKGLVEELERTRVSKTEAAYSANIHLSRFSQIVNGWTRPNEDERKRIAAVFETDPQEIFRE